jgi:hypothetical protein
MFFSKKIPHQKSLERAAECGLEDFLKYLKSPWSIIWTNFVAGLFRGLGFIIGATVLIAVATFILVKVLGNLPWVGESFKQIGEFFQNLEQAAQTLRKMQ